MVPSRALPPEQPVAAARLSELLLENVKEVAIFAVDENGMIGSWNVGAERLFGYPAAEALGLPYSTIFPPEDIAAEKPAAILEEAENQGRFEEEGWRVRKGGTGFWAKALVTTIDDAQGDLVGFAVLTRDLSAERQARMRERRVGAVLEMTTDLVALADAEGHFEYLNSAGRRLLGLGTHDDVSVLDFQAIHSATAAGELLRQALPTAIRKDVWRGDSALQARGGDEIPVSEVLIAQKNPAGEVEFLATIARDITERKQAERMQGFLIDAGNVLAGELESSTLLETLVHLAVPTVADACILDLLDGTGSVAAVAAAHADPGLENRMQALLHHPIPVLEHMPTGIHKVLQTGQAELVPELIDSWLRAAIPDEQRLQVARALHPTSAIVAPLVARGHRLGAITFIVSSPGRRYGSAELKVAQQFATRAALAIDNRRLHDQLQRAVKSRDDVLAIVAHDLRNPLNTVSMAAELLLQQPATEDNRANWVGIIQRSVAVANQLIGDLLDVSRIDAGRLVLERTEIDLSALLHEVCEGLQPQADRRSIHLECEPLPEPCTAWADPARVRQVLSNLAGNALKFTGDGGTVTIRADPVADAIQLSVLDTGIGMTEEEREHVFDRFWQARQSRRGGAGLGLAIARGIVEAHGGRIWTEPRSEGGSVFSFTLPLRPPHAPEADHPQLQLPPR